jgi:AcrR family transcriptional regulator
MAEPATRVTAPASRRRGPASTEDGQRSRDRVLQAALDVIMDVGIDRVRLAEIARRASMSSGQVMYYFTSKEHILLETLAWREHQDSSHRRAVLRKVTGAWRKLDRLIGLYLPSGPADPTWILWLEAFARAPHNRDVSQFLDDLMNPWREDIAEIVVRGIEDGEFTAPADIDDFIYRYTAVLDGLSLQGMRQMHQVTRKRLRELAIQAARLELAPPSPESSPE